MRVTYWFRVFAESDGTVYESGFGDFDPEVDIQTEACPG